jgi:hypothetical protein
MKKTIVLIALAVLLALPAATAQRTQELLRWVPSSATVVIAIDSAALRSQPVVQEWLLEHQQSWSGHDADFDRFLTDAGLDPLRDVDALVVAVTSGNDDSQVLALAAGRYDPSSLAAAFVKRGATVEKVAGVDLYTFKKVNGSHPEEGAVAIRSAELVIGGDPASVRAALSGGPSTTNLATMEIAAGRVDPRAHFWAVALVPEEVRQKAGQVKPEASGDGSEIVQGLITAGGTVTRLDVQATLGKELELAGSALADSAEDAGLLRDSAKGALAALRLHVKDTDPELVEVLRDVNIRADGAEVRGSVAIPVALIQKWAKQAGQHHHQVESTGKTGI